MPELGGSRPDRLHEVRPQEWVQRRTEEQLVDAVPLDEPVPLVVEQLVTVLAEMEREEDVEMNRKKKNKKKRKKKKKKKKKKKNRRLSQACPFFLFASPFLMDLSWQPSSGAAQRRRGRRLRAAWRHEQQSIAQALAAFTHHSALRGPKKARAGEEESEVHHTAEVGKTPPPQPVLFSLYDGDPGGGRPASLAEPPGPQERVQRHTVEHTVDLVRVAPMVQILDAPVPRTAAGHQALLPVPEHVIEVLKILLDDVPVRTAMRDTQLVDQLVEVPTIVSYSWLQLSMEQNVNIPVPGRGGRIAGLQGFSSGQSSTAPHLFGTLF